MIDCRHKIIGLRTGCSPNPVPIFRDEGMPYITAKEKRYFQEAMKTSLECFKQAGKTCNVRPGELIDDLKDGCEVAMIGHEFTWHVHPCGKTPSPADVQTTSQLGRRYLMIGHAPTKTTLIYDLGRGGQMIAEVR